MRALLIGVLAVSVAGCTFGAKTCSDTSECGAGATCQQGFCVAVGGETGGGDGQTGGGTATGGGTGTGGGSSTDGGEDGGMDAGPSPCELLNCTEACLDVDGGASCVGYFSGIATRTPDAGTTRAPGLTLFAAEVILGGAPVGTPPYPSVLVGTIDGVSASFPHVGNGSYSASQAISCDGGVRSVDWSVSFEDGGSLATSSFTCDGKPPVLTLTGLDAGVRRRDDVVVVELTADEMVTEVSMFLASVPVSSSTVGIDGNPCAANAGCWRINFAVPPLQGITASMVLQITAKDPLGNQAPVAQASRTLSVTRERWLLPISGSILGTIASPAIGADGYVYLGTSNGAAVGSLYRIDPVAGAGVDGGVSIGAVQGLAVAPTTPLDEDVVFVSYNTTRGELVGRVGSDLATVAGANSCQGVGSSKSYVAPALYLQGTEVAAVSSANKQSTNEGRAFRWRPGACDQPNVDEALDANAALSPPVNVVVANAATSPVAHFIQYVDKLSDINALRSVTLGSTPALDAGLDFDGGGAHSQVLIGAKSLVSNTQGVEVSGAQGRYTRSLVSGSPGGTGWSEWLRNGEWDLLTQIPAIATLGAPSLRHSSDGYVGFGSAVLKFSPTAPAELVNAVPGFTASSDILTAPILLEANAGTEWGYVVDGLGNIGAFPMSGTGSAWFANESTHPVKAHPSFSCNTRPGAASGTGVMFIASTDGWLRAVIVDGSRLSEQPGAWPKYQRTMGNAGNDDTVNFPTNWPGICP